MNTNTIDLISEKDLPYVARIIHDRWGYDYDQALIEASAYLANDERFSGFCVHADTHETVGVGLFSCDNDDVSQKYSPWLYLLWVDPPYRGNGLGIRITKKRMDHARLHGYKKIYIDTYDATAYHRNLGWEEVETIIFKGRQTTIMEWDLSEPFPLEPSSVE